jgi:hypothetical protein
MATGRETTSSMSVSEACMHVFQQGNTYHFTSKEVLLVLSRGKFLSACNRLCVVRACQIWDETSSQIWHLHAFTSKEVLLVLSRGKILSACRPFRPKSDINVVCRLIKINYCQCE